MGNDEKLSAAWAYLNERKISVLKHGFKPTIPAATNTLQTVERYRAQMEEDAKRQAEIALEAKIAKIGKVRGIRGC